MTVSRMQSGSPPVRNAAYQRLVAERNRFTVIMTVTFLVLYFLLPILAGYNKPLMATKVFGNVTFGYVFAFAEFAMGWIMAAIYVARARQFDRLAQEAQQ
ncbi:DUF485 domain-containing protein [Deinococcus metallilatus]|uniref:DUF485 domain-containing protein n=2 Tax=Deinococcus TaxID=1298 RepID=A0AAJ5F6M6_9DEIO|nr:DUF485 domain-containing protein [Deinococcus metallilatus]MBB5295455.1 uncharacterized membrane protein (DUF485 family) [Deinococcus metallilatus]QBY08023.1 DUF485 domain-containing protein [Deinococcus metallilatus]RXJ12917.1 DUF485 domain-containing protein [Deinococcus metallilatus]TLK27161.1 DUF485 domain-containing protein [Deinococcus metallilatus]GMA16133.1 hypothetical protein GCM10025871_24640 [Deinococcus metallilatus]